MRANIVHLLIKWDYRIN